MSPSAKPSSGASISKMKSSSTKRKAPSPQVKVEGRDPRIRLPLECAQCVFQLTKVLGHHTAGQTVEWLLMEAKTSVDAVLKPSPTPLGPTQQAYHPPVVPFPPMITQNKNHNFVPISQSSDGCLHTNEEYYVADEIAKFFDGPCP